MLVRRWSNQNSHMPLVEIKNVLQPLRENSLAISLKFKHTPTIWRRHLSPRYFTPEKWKHVSTQRLVHNYSKQLCWYQPKMETTQCPSTSEWINKLWRIHTMECYSGKKKDLTIDITARIRIKIVMLSESCLTKRTQCYSLYVKLYKMQTSL